MPRPPSDAIQIAIRVPEPWLAEADEIARLISRPGFEASRTDAFRAAISKGFEALRQAHSKDRVHAIWNTIWLHHQDVVAKPAVLKLGTPAPLQRALGQLKDVAKTTHETHVLKAIDEYAFVLGKGSEYAASRSGQKMIPQNYDQLYAAVHEWLQRLR